MSARARTAAPTSDARPNADATLEALVLGQVLEHADRVLPVLRDAGLAADHFARDCHRRIYRAALAVADAGQTADLVSVTAAVRARGDLDAVGGPAYIAALASGSPRWAHANAAHHAERLVALGRTRALSAALHDVHAAIDASDGHQADAIRSRLVEALAAFDGAATTDARPALLTLRERLARPRVVAPVRLAGWQTAGSRVLLSAQFKSGKTTLVESVIRSLVDGDDFLGRHYARPIDGAVVLLDFEMGDGQLDDWYRPHGIRADDRVIVETLRGRARTFNPLDAANRRTWADWLRARRAQYLVLDCVRPIMDALGLDEHREAGRLLEAVDALLVEAGIPECLVVHHMGHVNERARGDSRFRDWPDCEWRLVRKDADDPGSPRFLSAYGRDVDQPEQALSFDPDTRRLTLAGGSRKDAKLDEALAAIGDVLAHAEPQSGRAIKKELEDSDHARNVIDAALKRGVRLRTLRADDGPHGAKLYRRASVPVSPSVPPVSRDSVSECPDDYKESGHWDTTQSPDFPSVPSRDTAGPVPVSRDTHAVPVERFGDD